MPMAALPVERRLLPPAAVWGVSVGGPRLVVLFFFGQPMPPSVGLFSILSLALVGERSRLTRDPIKNGTNSPVSFALTSPARRGSTNPSLPTVARRETQADNSGTYIHKTRKNKQRTLVPPTVQATFDKQPQQRPLRKIRNDAAAPRPVTNRGKRQGGSGNTARCPFSHGWYHPPAGSGVTEGGDHPAEAGCRPRNPPPPPPTSSDTRERSRPRLSLAPRPGAVPVVPAVLMAGARSADVDVPPRVGRPAVAARPRPPHAPPVGDPLAPAVGAVIAAAGGGDGGGGDNKCRGRHHRQRQEGDRPQLERGRTAGWTVVDGSGRRGGHGASCWQVQGMKQQGRKGGHVLEMEPDRIPGGRGW